MSKFFFLYLSLITLSFLTYTLSACTRDISLKSLIAESAATEDPVLVPQPENISSTVVEDNENTNRNANQKAVSESLTDEIIAAFTQEKLIDLVGDEVDRMLDLITGMDLVGDIAEEVIEDILTMIKERYQLKANK